jgi:hypothetical protein
MRRQSANMPAATKSAMNKVKSPTNCAISGLLSPAE